MRLTDKTADAIYDLIMRILDRPETPVARVWMGVWLSANTVDANLSKISMLNGDTVDFVPKSNAVTGLTAGDPVLLVRGPTVPMTIIAKVHGDISVAQI